MSFITRAFTPPGTGAAQANAIMAAGQAQMATQTATQATQAALTPPPTAPTPPQAPPAPAQFSPSATPGTSQRPIIAATSFLGAGAAAGQTAKTKSVLG